MACNISGKLLQEFEDVKFPQLNSSVDGFVMDTTILKMDLILFLQMVFLRNRQRQIFHRNLLMLLRENWTWIGLHKSLILTEGPSSIINRIYK